MDRFPDRRLLACSAAALLCVATLPARAAWGQSLLDRSPNITGDWVGPSGTLHFNFLHRFTTSDPPARKVISSPTFLVGAGLPWRSFLGFNYATNSDVVPRYPNEWEFFGRLAPLAQERGGLADVGVQGGYNLAARSMDGEITLGRRVGPVTLRAAARGLSDAFDLGESRAVLAGGGVLRLGRYIAVAGDYATMLDRPEGYDDAWSAALQLAIPYTPHTLSLQVTNTNTATLQGASASRGGLRRYGFEFTIPVTLSRYIPRRAPPPVALDTARSGEVVADSISLPAPAVAAPVPVAPVPAPPDSVSVPRDSTPVLARPDTARATPAPAPARSPARRPVVVVRTEMRSLKFTPARIEIPAGSTVVWTNADPLQHTVTADDKRWDSGLIDANGTYRRRFDRPGTYTFHCTPHPFMKGVVVVR